MRPAHRHEVDGLAGASSRTMRPVVLRRVGARRSSGDIDQAEVMFGYSRAMTREAATSAARSRPRGLTAGHLVGVAGDDGRLTGRWSSSPDAWTRRDKRRYVSSSVSRPGATSHAWTTFTCFGARLANGREETSQIVARGRVDPISGGAQAVEGGIRRDVDRPSACFAQRIQQMRGQDAVGTDNPVAAQLAGGRARPRSQDGT